MIENNKYEQLLKDYNWVVNSIPLLNSGANSGNILLSQLWINKLSFTPDGEKLASFLQTRNTKLLGKYFEALFEFFLINSKEINLLLANKQVQNGNNTIGEIDYLFEHSGKIVHLEVAGKFYLSSENLPDWSSFIGPNCIDNLKRKFDHTVNSQMKITKTDAGKKLLSEYDINPNDVVSKFLLKGYIFYKAEFYFNNTFVLPQFADPEHEKGWWVNYSDCRKVILNSSTQWILLERQHWMPRVTGVLVQNTLTSLNLLTKLDNYFSENFYPLLVVQLREIKGKFNEISRGFITSDNWPFDENKNMRVK